MDKIDLQIGMTVFYREREYVVAAFREQESHEGRSMQVECLEPIYAQRNKMDLEARRASIEHALRIFPKEEKMLDAGLDELGK